LAPAGRTGQLTLNDFVTVLLDLVVHLVHPAKVVVPGFPVLEGVPPIVAPPGRPVIQVIAPLAVMIGALIGVIVVVVVTVIT
jgi:hypothetical protein